MARRSGRLFTNKKWPSGSGGVCPACGCLCTISEQMKAEKNMAAHAGVVSEEARILREQLNAANARIAALEAANDARAAEAKPKTKGGSGSGA